MGERVKQKLGFVVAAVMMVAALAALNVGAPAGAQQQGCEPSGGGNETESPSPSPTESEDPFPPSLPPIIPSESESESASPSPSDTQGQNRKCSSEITINYKGPNREKPERRVFSGKVKSDEDACEGGRKVILKKDRKGKRDLTIDTTVTNQRGSWSIPVTRANGRYYAKTPKEKVPADDGQVTCGADKSPVVKV